MRKSQNLDFFAIYFDLSLSLSFLPSFSSLWVVAHFVVFLLYGIVAG